MQIYPNIYIRYLAELLREITARVHDAQICLCTVCTVNKFSVLVNKRLCIRKYPFMMDVYENYAAPLQPSEERKVFMRRRSYDDGKLAQGQPIDREANKDWAGLPKGW
jgi:hypothetical protein